MRIYIGSDHRGFKLKASITQFLEKMGHSVFDVGNNEYDPKDDYPDFGRKVALSVRRNKGSHGVALCGSGAGICIAANKVKGIRAVLAFEIRTVRAARRDDNVNVLCLGSDFVSEKMAKKIVSEWLKAPFRKVERYRRRVKQLDRM